MDYVSICNIFIAGTNLVLISSIFPPGAKLISRTAGLKLIKPGQILFTIYSKNQTNEPRRHITASVGLPNQKINPDTGISQNTTRLDNHKRRQETMQKILPRKCSHPRLVFHLTSIKAGMRKDNSGPYLEKFTKPATLPNLHEATKTENGPRLLLQQYLCSRCVFLEHMLIR